MLRTHGLRRTIGMVGVPVVAVLLLLLVDLSPGHPEVTRMAAVALLMAGWWITEAIPIPATALLPVALFPLLGILGGNETAAYYFNDTIFLFVGGFIFALAMQRWKLHRRIALRIILVLGTEPQWLMLGFMAATWFLSMWISNTATTMMMVPMAMAIVAQLKEHFGAKAVGRYAVGLLLSIAYAASVGGFATLIGTPPNLAFKQILTIVFPAAPEVSFVTWFIFALPVSVVFLFVCWAFLVRRFPVGERLETQESEFFRNEYEELGRPSVEEKTILVLFAVLVFLWMFRQDLFMIPGWSRLLPQPGFARDGTVAIFVALSLFLIPARSRPGERLMDWETAVQLRWGIVLLFGGGFALAGGFENSGLSAWVGDQLAALAGFPPVVLVVATCGTLTFLTELTSNTATAQMALPVLGSLAEAIRVNPLLLMIPATLSASCAFMLPVATPPNAIVFGTGEVTIQDMARVGIILNLIGIVLITAAIYLVGIPVLGIDLSSMPSWALQ